MNPWFSMWNQPRLTVRSLVQSNPKLGIYLLSSIYVLQSLFFAANWWSLALLYSHQLIITLCVLFCPFIAAGWIYYISFIYSLTGRLFKGKAKPWELRVAIAWSRVPYSITLLMWFVLIFSEPEHIFIQDSKGPSSIFINITAFIVGLWSFALLVQSLREVQHFSLLKALSNVILAWGVSFVLFFIAFSALRYVYYV